MNSWQKEVKLYGLDHHQTVIDGIISELQLETNAFDVKLILAEAIINAHHHGNRSDCTKPIYIRYLLEENLLNLQIEDCGEGVGIVDIPREIGDEHLLDDSGRGLFLIRCFADNVEMIDNTIHIEKMLDFP
ncbi:MAG: hypothetical protein K0R57_2998 [Paenibacillaceae bacterium]|jgi:serine/threonine-protein kinase RsbW|nr:hypothetical protein [Paenibacillaceae bacterium]